MSDQKIVLDMWNLHNEDGSLALLRMHGDVAIIRNQLKISLKMKKILNPYLNKEGYNCVCCAPNNPVGLHLEFWEEGEDVLTIWNPGENYQGWINTLHGGIISMLMDEVAGWVINRKLQTTGVTMQLNVKYKKPVMTTDSQITVRGHIASQRRNIVTIHLTLENSQGEVCDEGEAIYFTFGPDKAREMGFDCCKVEGEE